MSQQQHDQPDLFDVGPKEESCLKCPRNKGESRCHGAWFPDSPIWKRQYCTIAAFRAMEKAA